MLGLLGPAGVAQADVWRVTRADGVVEFTNVRPAEPGVTVERLIAWDDTPESPGAPPMPPSGAAVQRAVSLMQASPVYHAVAGTLVDAARTHGLDAALLKAVVVAESAFNPQAVSRKGAVGLMQVMPATAQRYGVRGEPGTSVAAKLTDPWLNIHTGTRYLADLMQRFQGQTELALAAYNAGEGAVAKAGNRIPNYRETQQYVQRVMAVYRALQAPSG
ncbi:MAG: hypothetical protein OHK0048_23010 [Rhodoferax sp.]